MIVLERDDRGRPRLVELTVIEQRAAEWWADWLDTDPGTWGLADCAGAALSIVQWPPDPEFVEYLSDGALRFDERPSPFTPTYPDGLVRQDDSPWEPAK